VGSFHTPLSPAFCDEPCVHQGSFSHAPRLSQFLLSIARHPVPGRPCFLFTSPVPAALSLPLSFAACLLCFAIGLPPLWGRCHPTDCASYCCPCSLHGFFFAPNFLFFVLSFQLFIAFFRWVSVVCEPICHCAPRSFTLETHFLTGGGFDHQPGFVRQRTRVLHTSSAPKHGSKSFFLGTCRAPSLSTKSLR